MPTRLANAIVVKVGGSLFGWEGLPLALEGYLRARANTPVVLIAGGGTIVDELRALDRIHGLGEERSHTLALRAMDLTAEIVASLVPGLVVVDRIDGLTPAWSRCETPVFAPRRFLEGEDRVEANPLPHRWEVTSDSIAARLAVRIRSAQVVLLKSADAPPGIDRTTAASLGLVDPAFPGVAREIPRIVLVNLRSGTEPTDLA